MKKNMLPAIAALIIAILVLPTLFLPAAYGATPTTAYPGYLASVKTIPEDDLKDNTGLMVLGLAPTTQTLLASANWFINPTCSIPVAATGVTVGPDLTDEPIVWLSGLNGANAVYVTYYQTLASGAACVAHNFLVAWPKPIQPGWKLLSQHKILATLNGVPTTPTVAPLCEIVEKEKAKIPPQSTKPSGKRQFPDEMLKTTLIDVTNNFICKFRWAKPGVGVLDVYFVGPTVYNFIADHMLIVTIGYKVGTKTVMATDLQDICILGWSMADEAMAIALFPDYKLSEGFYVDTYWSWPNPLGPFVGCDEAAAWQLAWIFGGWGWSSN